VSGHCDSPGYSAKNIARTVCHTPYPKLQLSVVYVQLVMEKEGFNGSLIN